MLFVFFVLVKAVTGRDEIGSFDQEVDAVMFSLSAIVLNFSCTLFKLSSRQVGTALQSGWRNQREALIDSFLDPGYRGSGKQIYTDLLSDYSNYSELKGHHGIFT